MCGFCNVCMCMCVCLGVLVICVLAFTVFCIVSFMCVYSYLFCLYQCKDYCHRVTTQLQVVMMMLRLLLLIIIIIIIIIIITIRIIKCVTRNRANLGVSVFSFCILRIVWGSMQHEIVTQNSRKWTFPSLGKT